MKGSKPNSGKTRFNRGKPKGVSWIYLRDKAIREGTFKMPNESATPRMPPPSN